MEEKKFKIPKDRPAFHVDIHLKEAAKKAAQAFKEQEESLKREEYAKA